ncbi:MAG: hypothetical protein Q3M30_00165 [Candidatus Electrothrix sp. Rat3]|nr:hypothetical protein [Candidatus Electrothrix rattekaaiensis]
MKRLFYMALTIFFVVGAHTAAQAEAQSRLNDSVTSVRPGDILGGGHIGIKPPETDLRVGGISCGLYCCECQLNGGLKGLKDIGAFYMKEISVGISNYPSSNGGHVNIPSVLTLTYYDLTKNQEVTVVRKLPKMPSKMVLDEKHIEHYHTFINVVNSPVLVKKSKGIRVEIAPINDNTIDKDSANNVKIFNECDRDSQIEIF